METKSLKKEDTAAAVAGGVIAAGAVVGLVYLLNKLFGDPKCPNCNASVPPNSIYCPNCYSKLRWE
jgi:hypothetical protein